jgi:hypothetical protein
MSVKLDADTFDINVVRSGGLFEQWEREVERNRKVWSEEQFNQIAMLEDAIQSLYAAISELVGRNR